MSKRKRSETQKSEETGATVEGVANTLPTSRPVSKQIRRSSSRRALTDRPIVNVNPDENSEIKDAQSALRASPDAEGEDEKIHLTKGGSRKIQTEKRSASKQQLQVDSESSLSDLSDVEPISTGQSRIEKVVNKPKQSFKKSGLNNSDGVTEDPEAEDENGEATPEELLAAAGRPPPVNSSYLPLPWKGRLGYACLNTYLRQATPPVFSSRTCRIASILEHRHPLKDPSQPEHATKNRPDKNQPADPARGQAYVEALGLANARDIPKMLRWNDKYNIKFLRLSSEMFPFASHDVYGYKLAPFASQALAEAGRVATELGHRLTTHPGQFTQLGSPRPEVITAAIRDLEYHCELLDLLDLPEQANRDAVMILHMGGVFGDKAATIARFKENYSKLPQGIKNRIVLENDDVCYTVHDLLPVCEEMNIPLCLDFHHHNILFDADKIREGTLDIMGLYDRIKATWDRKQIRQKMHYSEQTPPAVTQKQRRKHNPRPLSLPPCPPDMDLMIEAKDKEQAVFEMMRNFKLPGFEKINDMLPYTRLDENKPWKPPKKKTQKKKKGQAVEEEEDEVENELQPPPIIPDEEIAMGGPENRVYWPPGMEEYLRSKKREVKPRDPEKAKTTAEKAAARRAEKAAWQAAREASAEPGNTDASVKGEAPSEEGGASSLDIAATKSVYNKKTKAKPARAAATKRSIKATVLTPSTSDHEDEEMHHMSVLNDTENTESQQRKPPEPISRKSSSRAVKGRAVNYADHGDSD